LPPGQGLILEAVFLQVVADHFGVSLVRAELVVALGDPGEAALRQFGVLHAIGADHQPIPDVEIRVVPLGLQREHVQRGLFMHLRRTVVAGRQQIPIGHIVVGRETLGHVGVDASGTRPLLVAAGVVEAVGLGIEQGIGLAIVERLKRGRLQQLGAGSIGLGAIVGLAD
jgi:hypothetical protein